LDQAITLREKVANVYKGAQPAKVENNHPVHVVAVTSGKGGVGKTNIVINTGIALAKMDYKVMIFDADLGLANVDVLLGLTPRYNMRHVLAGQRSLEEIIIDGPMGVKILPAASGFDEITSLGEDQRLALLSHFENYQEDIDILLIDTGAGIGQNVMYFSSVARQIMVVATSEPTSITDAYAVMKVLATRYGEKQFTLLVNNVGNENTAKGVYQNLADVAERFLNISIDYAGFIPNDPNFRKAVSRQKPLLELFPEATSARAFSALAKNIMKHQDEQSMKSSLQFCWRRLLIKDNGGGV